MPSPFPGMDPYIESWIWGSFHTNLIVAICDYLNTRLPKRYIAATDLYVWRLEKTEDVRLLLGGPDVHVAEKSSARAGAGVATAAAPVITVLPGVVRKQRYVKIMDQHGRHIVAVVEILSPANKTKGGNGKAYRHKRKEYLASGVSLIEIDLLRSGTRPPLGKPRPQVSDYYILVHRGWEKNCLGIWPLSVRDRLPLVPVPLAPDVSEVMLELRACIDHVYDFGRYAEQLDYTKPPDVELREEDAAWACELLANRPAAVGG